MRDLVAVDIGGTHARFVLAEAGSETVRLGDPVTLETAEHASFHTAWEEFARRTGATLPKAAAIAVAGPAGGDLIRFTNNPWVIRPDQLRATLGLDHLTLVNDFAAVGHAVARSEAADFLHLAGPDAPLPRPGTISVVGPGTGLGVAYVSLAEGADYRIQATEGGHVDFAPLDKIEDRILLRLRARHRRVSVERVVSGPGIVDIYETLAAIEDRPLRQLDDRTIWQLGTSGEDALAAAAVERFCLCLGAIAGDFALAHGASAVVIAGGLGLRLRETLRRSGFAHRFRAKGRFESMMAGLPVKLIVHPQPGLFGAAAAFAKEHA